MADDRLTPSAPDAAVRAWNACCACWQLPLVLFASWWNAAGAGAAWPHARVPADPSDHQLVVPDPIEDEGEHALFA